MNLLTEFITPQTYQNESFLMMFKSSVSYNSSQLIISTQFNCFRVNGTKVFPSLRFHFICKRTTNLSLTIFSFPFTFHNKNLYPVAMDMLSESLKLLFCYH